MNDQSAYATEELKHQALQAVFDRVASWQDGATSGTVEHELRSALTRADIELDEHDLHVIADHLENDGSHVDVATLIDVNNVR